MQSSTIKHGESPAEDKIKGASSDLFLVPPGTSSLLLANTPIWAKWVLSYILYLTVPLYKRVLRIEDEVEKEVIDVVDIIKKVAQVTEKASSDLANALPAGSNLKKLATEVEDDAEEVNKDAEKVEVFINKLSMHNNSRNRGLAFITMASEEEALLALSNLNSYDLNGRFIKVEFARSLKRKTDQETTAPTSTFTVFVGNLAWRVRSRDLRELFGSTGKLISAEVIFQSNPRRSAGYGFVSYSTEEEAKAAIAAHNEKRIMGRKVRLVLGKPQADKSEGQSSEDILTFEASRESNP